ncbi:YdcF family protein [Brevibacillus daliensis]|uniref:YdcF family protein n=1 Tax=Brevibacillus daliensis TaxID=2892995 RepID=UPI001E4FCE80|nr:YdcF family protein [Brevibacillus daliensis]
MKFLWNKWVLLAGVLFLLLVLIWFGTVFYRMIQVEKEAKAREADVAIVLGAAVWDDKPSPGLTERLNKAQELYEQKFVKAIIVSGGLGEGDQFDEATVMKQYLTETGIPAEAIHMENQATNTLENLRYSKAIMNEKGYKNALIVSHDYHLMRAMEIADAVSLEAYPVGTTSHVMYGPYYRVKESFAYLKWTYHKWFVLPREQ